MLIFHPANAKGLLKSCDNINNTYRTMATKRVRSGRASDSQLMSMIQFFETNKGIAEGKFQLINGKEELQNKWAELANDLNSSKGATKTTAQWQVTWRDLKSRTSQKARKIRLERNETGNKESKESPLTPLELRVIGLVGTNYIEGSSDCPDSVPEEEDIQEQLAAGDSSALMRPPKVTSIFSNFSTTFDTTVQKSNMENDSEVNENHSDDPIDFEFVYYNNDDGHIEKGEVQAPVEYCDEVMEESRSTEILPTITPKKSAAVATTKNRPYLQGLKRQFPTTINNACSSGPRRHHPEKQSKQLSSVRDQFAAISESHAQSMMMLAEATKLQAKAAKDHANAMNRFAVAMEKQADAAVQHATNDTARIEVMARLVEVLSQILPTYSS